MSTVNHKFLDLQGVTTVAGKVNEKLKKVTTMPANPSNGDIVLYVGTTSNYYTNGLIYSYDSSVSRWVAKGVVPTIENTSIVFNL